MIRDDEADCRINKLVHQRCTLLDVILNQDIGFVMLMIEKTPTGFFQHFIYFDACFGFFVHFSLTPMGQGLI
jgi:hypothetical protein